MFPLLHDPLHACEQTTVVLMPRPGRCRPAASWPPAAGRIVFVSVSQSDHCLARSLLSALLTKSDKPRSAFALPLPLYNFLVDKPKILTVWDINMMVEIESLEEL